MLHGDRCTEACTRYNECINTPCLSGIGNENAKIMLVGESPGQLEDKRGIPFIGASGRLLDEILADCGIGREELYITNAVKCAIAGENKAPSKKEIKLCRPYLVEEINRIKPTVIGAVGAIAMESILGRTDITKLHNNVFWSDEFNTKVVPVFHPAHILRNPGFLQDLTNGIGLIKNEATGKEIVGSMSRKIKCLVADTPEKINQVFDEIDKRNSFVVDLETTSLNFMKAKIVCVALAWKKNVGVVIPYKSFDSQTIDRFQRLLVSNKTKIGHNIKYDIHVLLSNGFKIRGPFFDTILAHALIDDNARERGLDALVLRYLDLGEYWAELEKWKADYAKKNGISKNDVTYDLIPPDILYPYAVKDAISTFDLCTMFLPELKRQGLYEYYTKYFLTTMNSLVKAEHVGVLIDRERLKKVTEEYKIKEIETENKIWDDPEIKKFEETKIKELTSKIRKKYDDSKIIKSRFPNFEDYFNKNVNKDDYKFNVESSPQMQKLFFHQLKLKPVKLSKKTKKPSTDEEVMNHFASEGITVAKSIVEKRSITKYINTYLESTYKRSEFDGRLHPNYLQHSVLTGRLSSKDPNLQNIPRDAKDYKQCFLADVGFSFIKADLAQAEFRCWAHYSEDEDLIADIASGLDIHRKMASEVFGIPPEEVTDEQRTQAKRCVFGLMFGEGTKALAQKHNITIEQAERIREIFFSRYPRAKQWLKKQIMDAKEHKFVKSWIGKVRRLPDIDSSDNMVAAKAERQAMNSPIQSLSSDMNNYFMYKTLAEASKLKIKCNPALTTHDENVYCVEDGKIDEMVKIIGDVIDMAFPGFRCKMFAECKIGKNLGDTTPYKGESLERTDQ